MADECPYSVYDDEEPNDAGGDGPALVVWGCPRCERLQLSLVNRGNIAIMGEYYGVDDCPTLEEDVLYWSDSLKIPIVVLSSVKDLLESWGFLKEGVSGG